MPDAEEMWTIVVGGGSARRFGTLKQYEDLGGARVIDRSVAVAGSVSHGVVVVVPPDDAAAEGAVAGGSTRSESVRAGLAEIPETATIICVHDAARPLATADLFRRVVAAVVAGADGAVPAVPVTDTVKVVRDQIVVSTPDRDSLVAVQTPQCFRAAVLRRAYEQVAGSTDDAALVEAIGATVVVVDGEPANRKITLPDDLRWAREQFSASTRSS